MGVDSGPGAKRRILFVDDDSDTCDMMSILLGSAGYEVLTAATMNEGLSLAKEGEFDLIMLDWHLEDGNGVELCRAIRDFNRRTPIFFYTGVAQDSYIKEALQAGAQGCFIKPVNVSDLLHTLSAHLNKRNSPQKSQ